MKTGKKLYRSTSIITVKVLAVVIIAVTFLNLYFQTFNDIHFEEYINSLNLLSDRINFATILKYHLKYPEELIFFTLTILCPGVYYGFIRSVIFYENGMTVNKGLPFFNTYFPYGSIEQYEIINPKRALALKFKNSGDEILLAVNNPDRVVAILDQNNISGNLGHNDEKDYNSHLKLAVFFLIVGVLIALVQYSGFLRQLIR